jgi:hypothetical protein
MKDQTAAVLEVVYWVGVIALWACAIMLNFYYQSEGRYNDGMIAVASVIGLHLLWRWALRISKIKKMNKKEKKSTSWTRDKKPFTWGSSDED